MTQGDRAIREMMVDAPRSDLVAIFLLTVVCSEVEHDLPGFREQLCRRLKTLAELEAAEAESDQVDDRAWGQRLSRVYLMFREALSSTS